MSFQKLRQLIVGVAGTIAIIIGESDTHPYSYITQHTDTCQSSGYDDR